MKKLLVCLMMVGLLASAGTGTAYGESEELLRMMARPRELTQADWRTAVVLSVGDLFSLKLGEFPEWEVAVPDTDVLYQLRTFAAEPGVQGTWEAKAPGTVVIRAVGYLPCHRQQPACKAANPMFEATILVQPRHMVNGEFRIGKREYRLDDFMAQMQGPSFLENSRTYVPAADLAAALGAVYHEQGGQAVLKTGGPAVVLNAGSKEMAIGEVTVGMDVAPVMRHGVLYLPMRWVAEALGYRVGWDGAAWMATFDGE